MFSRATAPYAFGLLVGFCVVPFVLPIFLALWILGAGQPETDEEMSADPLLVWRRDRHYARVVSVVVGAYVAALGGLVLYDHYFTGSSMTAPAGAALLGTSLAFGGLAGGAACLISGATWPTRLTFLQLHRSVGTPVALLAFLEDAGSRGILRAVGRGYEFRHALLRDYLLAHEPHPPGP
ncbi:hypothetical protein ACWT_3157 [Actinoplanes sp. SE50]|uniref:hypothetical protein n=1 Tax=unclassified Actinoplanes TaxID=2626549 RepID=UPI00023EC603|nr:MULTISPECIES: hypothetical protein [unclassified Actinoplanes]AEV84180.1 hypothetical protein ACPL_3285 [Actinoplanes sp. SE50/110]ATO82572.1 hypothetical protein ACWT_3157 [Actinoplanes sp. SE50]SLL99979.1 hypothetical protein ACSP50_3211 [Actinoplanes sp. SE50/110]